MNIPTGGTTSSPMKAIYSGALKRLRRARYTQSFTMKILAFCYDRLRRITAANRSILITNPRAVQTGINNLVHFSRHLGRRGQL